MAKTTATTIPPLQVQARSVGKFKFICPNCGQEYPLRTTPWRRFAVQCDRCKAKFQFGIGFQTSPAADAYLQGKWDSFIVNRINPTGTPFSGTKVYGTLEWACPDCNTPQSGYLNYESKLPCSRCYREYYISLLIYRLPKYAKSKAPIDSIVKGLKDVRQNDDTLPAEAVSEIAGEDSSF